MEEKKHRKPRPEMGTPEYEEWRKRMLQRRRERLKREQTPAKQFLQRLPVIHPVIQFPAILWRRRIFWLSSMIMIKPLIF